MTSPATNDSDAQRTFVDRVARPGLALGAGALVALSLPPWGFWPLAFFGIALFDLTISETTTRTARARRGFVFGAGWMFLGMGWMIQLTGPGYIAAALIFATFHAAAAAIGTTSAADGRWSVLARPLAHALVEALRFSFPFGGVPLATLGMSQVGGPLSDVVRVGGVVLLTWVTFQFGFAIVPGIRAALRRIDPDTRDPDTRDPDTHDPDTRSIDESGTDTNPNDTGPNNTGPHEPGPNNTDTINTGSINTGSINTGPNTTDNDDARTSGSGGHGDGAASGRVVSVALCLAIAAVAASIVAPSGTDTGDSLRLALVQGGGEQGTSALDVKSIVVTERHLAATASIEPDPDLDLVFWPENTIDVVTFETSDVVPLIVAEASRLGVPIAVGLTEDVEVDGKRRFTNAHVVVTPDGEIFSRYDKVRRVPFGEYVPLRSVIERFSSAVDRVGDAVAGETPAVLELPDGQRLATVISWEVFFGGRSREGVALGSEMIVNPTNGASYTGTIVQTQQIASSRLRAIETGRWVAQAAPTGFTAFVSPEGDVLDRTTQREQRVITRDVPLREGSTWYVSLGDRPFIVAMLVGLIALLALDLRPRRSASPDRR